MYILIGIVLDILGFVSYRLSFVKFQHKVYEPWSFEIKKIEWVSYKQFLGLAIFLFAVGTIILLYGLYRRYWADENRLNNKILQKDAEINDAVKKECPNCHSGISKEAFFCPKCGTHIAEQIDENNYCRICGNKIGYKDVFCPYCGNKRWKIETTK